MSLLSLRTAQFYDAWESMSGAERSRILSDRLSEYVSYARRLEESMEGMTGDISMSL